ncbi:phage holin family protein [Cupriavidus basilensis]|uniref:phage holin family protein n=1 Tax=Cupriavidus basilensis TaxID=68895 RepID=UPI00157BA886|nr:phage holin family protein [Cupriavidus basilensis]NUA26091.1 holin [Cupriavidus basilensis]
MQEHEKSLAMLVAMGAMIALGKLLVSDEDLTFRRIIGRALLGAATSMIAGVGLIQFPELPPLALYGIGCGLGIVGSQYIEVWLKRKLRQGAAK